MIRQSKVGPFRTRGVRGLGLFVAALGLICAVIAGMAESWTYDSRIYQVTVQFWNDNSEKLTPKVFVYEIDASGKKVGKAELCSFDNVYKAPAVPEPPAEQKPEQKKEMNPDTSDTNSITTIQALSALGIAFIGIAVCMGFGKRKNEK